MELVLEPFSAATKILYHLNSITYFLHVSSFLYFSNGISHLVCKNFIRILLKLQVKNLILLGHLGRFLRMEKNKYFIKHAIYEIYIKEINSYYFMKQ